ncbi:DUF6279 family lipoprotein [Pseudoalteromonas sp. 68 DY56-GL68]|uniref:DUF6279 family lipoprotein n=1 Tax=Pseudoalteromonas sp. 68 DY56-GL68 TaxID=2974919 RepID=UPI00352BAFE0
MNNLLKYFVILCLVFATVGCSASFTYNNLGWLSGFWIDDYVDLNSQQSDKFKQIVKTSRDWHRETQLPLYKKDLESLKSMLDVDVNQQQLKQHFLQAKQHWQTLVEKLEPDLINLANSLSIEQRTEFVAAIQASIDDEYEEYKKKTLAEHKKERLEENLENYKEWLGKLSNEQKKLIETAANDRIETSLLWLEYKQTRLDALKQLFTAESKREDFDLALAVIINNRSLYMSEALIKADDENLDNYVELLVALQGTLTQKQRRNIHDEFDELIEQVSDLIDD